MKIRHPPSEPPSIQSTTKPAFTMLDSSDTTPELAVVAVKDALANAGSDYGYHLLSATFDLQIPIAS